MKKLTILLILLLLSLSLLGAGCIGSKTAKSTTPSQSAPKTFHIIITTSQTTTTATKESNVTTVTTINVQKIFEYYDSIILGKPIRESVVIVTDTYYPAGAALVSDNFRIIIPASYVLSGTTYIVPALNGSEKLAYYSFAAIISDITVNGTIGPNTAEITGTNETGSFTVYYENGIIAMVFSYGTLKISGEMDDILPIVPPQVWPKTYHVINGTTYKFATQYNAALIAEYSGKSFTIYTHALTDTKTTRMNGYVISVQIIPVPTKTDTIKTTIVNGIKAIKIITSGRKTTVAIPPALEKEADFFKTIVEYADGEYFGTIRTLLLMTRLPQTTELDAWKNPRLAMELQFIFTTASPQTIKPLSAVIRYGAANNREFAMFYVVALWALGETPTLNIVNAGDKTTYFVQDGEIAFINTVFGCNYTYLLNSIYAHNGAFILTKITMPAHGDYIIDSTTITTMSPIPIVYSGGVLTVIETYTIKFNTFVTKTTHTYIMSNGTLCLISTSNGETLKECVKPGDEDYEYALPLVYAMKPLYTTGNTYVDPYNWELVNITAIAGFDGGTILAVAPYADATVTITYTIIGK